MKIEHSLAVIFILLGSSACIIGSAGPVVVDIVGSNAENVLVEPGCGPIELEIVGGEASNVRVGPEVNVLQCNCGKCCYPDMRCNVSKPSYPWESMHLGVDAWYGTFWYTDVNMPRWPQVHA